MPEFPAEIFYHKDVFQGGMGGLKGLGSGPRCWTNGLGQYKTLVKASPSAGSADEREARFIGGLIIKNLLCNILHTVSTN